MSSANSNMFRLTFITFKQFIFVQIIFNLVSYLRYKYKYQQLEDEECKSRHVAFCKMNVTKIY
jgi:hypothetical protein